MVEQKNEGKELAVIKTPKKHFLGKLIDFFLKKPKQKIVEAEIIEKKIPVEEIHHITTAHHQNLHKKKHEHVKYEHIKYKHKKHEHTKHKERHKKKRGKKHQKIVNEKEQTVIIENHSLSSAPVEVNDNLTEIEEEALKAKKIENKPEKVENETEGRKKIRQLAENIANNRRMTDFDRILLAVNSHSTIRANELMHELKMEKKHFMDCVAILQKSGDLKVEYPLIGAIKLSKVSKKEEDGF